MYRVQKIGGSGQTAGLFHAHKSRLELPQSPVGRAVLRAYRTGKSNVQAAVPRMDQCSRAWLPKGRLQSVALRHVGRSGNKALHVVELRGHAQVFRVWRRTVGENM